ncbi:FAD/NAD(P)-dependent oxidoreductase [Roseibium sp. M-1]
MRKPGTKLHLGIVGAGPAGLGAAIAAREAGLDVTVIDDQLEPGGQIWRAAGSAAPTHAERMGPEYVEGRDRVQQFLSCGAHYLPQHTLWHIEIDDDGIVLHCAGPDGSRIVRPDRLLLATGAVERPIPVPGWTLPGVMTAGGLQILLKSAQLSSDKAVLAGAGPLLWLLAAQMIKAGTPPLAVVECVGAMDYLSASWKLPSALRYPGPLKKGLGLITKVRQAGVPIHLAATDLHIDGDFRARALRFRDWRGRERCIKAETVGLHGGVVPNQQASRLLRLPHTWSTAQHAFLPDRDQEMRVDKDLYMAGDGARIGGAEVAWLEGTFVGRHIAGLETSGLRRALARANSTRPFLDSLYRPAKHLRKPADTTVLCRCEAVTAGRIRQAVRDGAPGPNQVKFMLRAGMGPCQGRVCGLAVSEVVAETLGQSMQQTGYFRIRPPLKPMSLGVIAAELADDPAEEDDIATHAAR